MTTAVSADGIVWNEYYTRPAVALRSGGRCEWCGHEGMEMHHRVNRSQRGGWHPSNIIHLCIRHHRAINHSPEWAKSVGLSVYPFTDGEPTDPATVPVRHPDQEPLWLTDALIAKPGVKA